MLSLWMACPASEADAWQTATQSGLALPAALAACEDTGTRAGACAAEVLRGQHGATTADCAKIQSPTWRAECSFAVAERHARAHQRSQALVACGQAGRYYHECIYHAWTYDIQGSIKGGGRAAAEIDTGRALVAYWGQLQTVGGDATRQIWLDWWFFTLNRNQPADLGDCDGLRDAEGVMCRDGTLAFVERAVATTLGEPVLSARRKSRVCRGSIEDVEAQFPNLYRADDTMRERALAGRARGCTPSPVAGGGRPWNPIFLEHRRWLAG
ncbi:MAG: hypothetical protein EXR71_04825 [Myxococcales bacterium]|nr:hypothetical protein [Myxococcales bacterium]